MRKYMLVFPALGQETAGNCMPALWYYSNVEPLSKFYK